jgi:cytoskeletal protein RodZ
MDGDEEMQVASVGERLRAAREEKGLALEDVAAQTRIPRRHLESIETADWDKLPAPTYTIGFARSYASSVGLDRTEIGDQLRAEMGGQRPASTTPEVFEAADPARTMPKWLVLGAIAAVLLLVLLMSWLNNRSLEGGEEPAEQTAAAPADPATVAAQAPPPAQPASEGPVVLTAVEPVWLQVYERGGSKLFEGELAAGQRFEVPANATAPLLRTGKPQALRINVGSATAPAVGPPATTVRDVSLLGADLMRTGQAPVAAPAARPAPAPAPAPAG